MKAGLFFTAVHGNLASWIIRRVTGGPYSHVGIYFVDHRAPHDVYFESHWGQWDRNGKSGVRGPLPLVNLQAWESGSPKHILKIQPPLPVSEDEALEMFVALDDATRSIHYAKLQLFHNWIRCRLGLSWYWGHGSSRRWTCSETAVRVLPEWLRGRLRFSHQGIGDIIYDDIMPGGINGVYEAVEALLEADAMESRGETELGGC